MLRKNQRNITLKLRAEYRRAVIVAAISVLISGGVFLWDNGKPMEENEQGQPVLIRNESGEGEREDSLRVTVGGREEEIRITVEEKQYDRETIRQLFAAAEEQLEEMILGENSTLDEIRSDMNLITQIPESNITVSWQSENYRVLDVQGRIGEEAEETGTTVKLTAVLSCGEEKEAYEFFVTVYPERKKGDVLIETIKEQITEEERNTRTEQYVVLPQTVFGEPLIWRHSIQTRAFAILIGGTGWAVFSCVSYRQKKKEEKKKNELQMMKEYPHILNKFHLYIEAGMTVRKAWNRIIFDYEKRKEKTGESLAYEEMKKTARQLKSGISEAECYEAYGERCGIPAYRKFGMMLSQNIRKGPKGLLDILTRESAEAFEERISLAKRLGEEAGTKMVIPMFMMLSVVFAIVIVPALFSIQI